MPGSGGLRISGLKKARSYRRDSTTNSTRSYQCVAPGDRCCSFKSGEGPDSPKSPGSQRRAYLGGSDALVTCGVVSADDEEVRDAGLQPAYDVRSCAGRHGGDCCAIAARRCRPVHLVSCQVRLCIRIPFERHGRGRGRRGRLYRKLIRRWRLTRGWRWCPRVPGAVSATAAACSQNRRRGEEQDMPE